MSHDDTGADSVTETTTTSFETAREPSTAHAVQDWDSTDSLLCRIVETVAEETGQHQEAMEPLHSVLDVDALERLLAGDGGSVEVTFSYEGCTIAAASDGTVVVHPENRDAR